MMAAGYAAEGGARVTLFEKNPFLGKKLNITGKGRCNITNDCDVQQMLENVPQNSRFLYAAFSKLTAKQLIEFFEKNGLPVKTERGGRVFPVSDKAADVTAALKRFAIGRGVQIKYDTVLDITAGEGVRRVVTSKGEIDCDSVIIATGGLSYPLTGSTGDGYRFAQKLGHEIVPTRPSLVPLETVETFVAELAGLALKNVRLEVFENGKRIFEDFGELLFTHFGVSGPLILSASAHMRDFGKVYTIAIDLKPALEEKTLNDRILRDFELFKNKDLPNGLVKLLPSSMIDVVVERLGVDSGTKINEITKETRRKLVQLLKKFTLTIKSPCHIDQAVITSGGVQVKQVDPKTMKSKLVPGLYFAGEVLDVDAYTGGFNLHIAFATGALAGQSAGM